MASILVIEDDDNIATLLSFTLEREREGHALTLLAGGASVRVEATRRPAQ